MAFFVFCLLRMGMIQCLYDGLLMKCYLVVSTQHTSPMVTALML